MRAIPPGPDSTGGAWASCALTVELFRQPTFEAGLKLYLGQVMSECGAAACVLVQSETAHEPKQAWAVSRLASGAPQVEALRAVALSVAGDHASYDFASPTALKGRPALLRPVRWRSEFLGVLAMLGSESGVAWNTPDFEKVLSAHTDLIAARLYQEREIARLEAKLGQYERGFHTLDKQLRVLDLERQKLAAVLNNAEIGFLVVGGDNRVTWANPAMALHLNAAQSGHAIVKQSCHEVVCGRPEPCPDCPALKTFADGSAHRAEVNTTQPVTRRLYTIAVPIRGTSGRVEEALLMVQDLTGIDSLRRSEARYRLLFESSKDSIFMAAPPDFGIVLANPATCRMLDYDPDRLLALTLKDLHPPDDWSRMTTYYAKALGGESTAPSDTFVLDRHGRVHFCSVTALPFDLEGQQVIMCTARDMTARKKAENELAHSLSLLQGTLESTADGILVVDTTGHATSFNRKFLEMWGVNADRGEANVVPDVLARVQAQLLETGRFEAELQQIGASSITQTFEVMQTRDGRTFERYSQPQRIDGITVGRVFSFRDITERTRAEQNLQDRLQFENLIATLSNHFITLASDEIDSGIEVALRQIGEFAQVDRSYIFLYSANRTRMSNTHEWCRDSIAPQKERIQNLPVEHFAWIDEKIRRLEVIHIPCVDDLPASAMAEKEEFAAQGILSLICVPLIYGKTLLGFLGFDSVREKKAWEEDDVALLHIAGELLANALSRKRVEQEKSSLEEQLIQSQKMEAVGTLAGGIAHDFNNLLTGILGYADLLGSGNLSTDQTQKAALVIERAARRAAELTQQLLGFARKGKYQNVAVDLHATIREVTTLFKRTFEKSITICTTLSSESTYIMGDPVQIQQVILNLAVNARDAMPHGGLLTFETSRVILESDPGDGRDHTSPREYVRLAVTDTGCGIPEEVQSRIFEPFFTTKEPGKGTGMGLSMVYGIVKNHGGSICVSSSPAQGSRFEVLLPAAQGCEEAPRRPKQALSGSARLLLVDDEEVVRNVASTILERLGYEVITARDGAEAVEIYRRERPHIDLVILDMAMPRMGGRDCFMALRAIDPQVRAILSTGYALDEATQRVLDEGMRGFAQKPYVSDDLASAVEAALKP